MPRRKPLTPEPPALFAPGPGSTWRPATIPDMPAPCTSTADTSRKARRRIRSEAGAMRLRVLLFVRSRGHRGATDEEIQEAVGIRVQSETPRRGELVKLGALVDSGRKRRTSSGRPAVVWTAPQDGEVRP